MKKPKIPVLPTDLMATFYAEAAAFYKAAPWKHCSDADIFGVLVPESGELHFISIMGGGGQCFGIATYRGWDGLSFFMAVADGAAEVDPDIILKEQDGLLLEFVTKDYLDEFEVKAARATGFRPVDRNGWIIVRELSPGWMPWLPREKDIIALRNAISAVAPFMARQKKNPEWTHAKAGESVPVFTWNDSKAVWKLEWWGPQKIMKNSVKVAGETALPPMDELLVARITSTAQKSDARWAAHSFYASEPVLEEDRPFFPKICALLDQTADICLGVEMAQPKQNAGITLRDLALKKMFELKIIPAVIAAPGPEYLFGLINLKETLGVEVELAPSDTGANFEAEFRKNAEHRN